MTTTTKEGRLEALRSGDLFGPLVLFSEKQPPNDYSYKCVIVFRDGYEALSDGGSVHDACVKSGIAHAWREVLPNVRDH